MEQKEALAALAALAHETRLAVFRLRVEAGPSGLPAGEIAERVGFSESSHFRKAFRKWTGHVPSHFREGSPA